MVERWNRFFRQCQKTFRLWLFFMAALSLNRVVFILAFRHEIVPDRALLNTIAVLAHGLWYDVTVSTYWILAPFAAGVACGLLNREAFCNRLRAVCAATFVVATVLISIVGIEYYREYHDVFSQTLFHLGDDDVSAIGSTIVAQYHPVRYLFLSVILIAAGLWIRKRLFSGEIIPERVFGRYTASHGARIAVSVAIAGLLVIGIRGSIGNQPVQVKDAAVTVDRMLNKAVLNPYIALVEAVNVHLAICGSHGLKTYLPDEDVVAALETSFHPAKCPATVDEYLTHTAAGPKTVPPRHVFLMLMESYDAWPMLDKYAGLKLVENGRRMAREGLHLRAFLPASDGTIDSFTAIITGLPYVSLLVRHEDTGRRPLPTSLPDTFRRLGYRTRFFYSGYLSWQDVGDFSRQQGFDEVYGARHTDPDAVANEWGVADQFLFDMVARTVTDERPSFNLILTTGYHPPYNFDLAALGVPLPTVPPELENEFEFDRSKMLTIYGHLRYADRSMGQFVQAAESRLPRSLFVLTGDHFGRRFMNSNPTPFESSAVPLVLYGQEVLRGVRLPKDVAGSHVDIAPTLIEAAAPKGFEYCAIGRNLLEGRDRAIGFNHRCIIGSDFVLDFGSGPRFSPIPGRPMPGDLPEATGLLHRCNMLQGIAWWRIRNGAALPEEVPLVLRPGGEVNHAMGLARR